MKRLIKMLPIYLTLIYLIINTDALSLETVRAQNVTKREANVGDLFPDWVPFKNKHGEELGEFVQVPKRKPKKRLAPPANFILRAVAEPEGGDDYFEKGQGETDSDDYYEKKEWSDIHREPNKNKNQNHTEISDIDGVVSIIVKRTNPVLEALKKSRQLADTDREEKDKQLTEKIYVEDQNPKPVVVRSETQNEKKDHKYEDEIEYEDSNTEKRNSDPVEDDPSENVRTKASILDSVDDLKERHADEQRLINEKIKEEEIYKEEREREKIQAKLSNLEHDKYDDNRPISKKNLGPDYEEYEDKDSATDEKYVISPEKIKSSTTSLPRTKKSKQVESGKLSVFKNPQLYIVYDDEFEDTTTQKPTKRNFNHLDKRKDKFSAKYTSTPTNKEDHERISLVPDEDKGKEGEPTLFFPKKRKNKKRKNKVTRPIKANDDSAVAATVAEKRSNIVSTSTDPDETSASTTSEPESTATDTVPTNTDEVTDVVAASTVHDDGKKHENYEEERGGAKEYSSAHDEEHSEEGKKAYEGVHKESKSAKGHHEKENHLGKYDDRAGVDKHDEEESGHYGAHHHEEHGKKHAKYEESGKHSKGHNTKGSHDIHKKEEYEKKVEFFEEEGDSAEEEKHGGFNHENSHDKGGHYKNGNYKEGNEEHVKGDSGFFAKGGNLHVSKGHKDAGGHDGHGKAGHAHGEKVAKNMGKKWIYHHGYPAKTANLVRVDRRADLYYHGPQYYG